MLNYVGLGGEQKKLSRLTVPAWRNRNPHGERLNRYAVFEIFPQAALFFKTT